MIKMVWPAKFYLELESTENGNRGCVIKTANVPTNYIFPTWKHSEYVEFLTEWSERSPYFLDPNSK